MTDISTVYYLYNIKNCSANLVNSITEASEVGPSFLRLTGYTGYNLNDNGGVVYTSDVLNGSVQDEIEQTQNENDTISSIIEQNTAGSIFDSNNVFTAKTITFESWEETTKKLLSTTTDEATGETTAGTSTASGTQTNIKTATDTRSIYRNIQYSELYPREVQEKIIKTGIDTLVKWLDDYINNYEEKVAEGKANGESEVKLSFLLRLRKAIENCEFPIGLGDYESDDGIITLGSFSSAYNTYSYLNPEDHANDNIGALQYFNSSIILNAEVFCTDRKYVSEYQLQQALDMGRFDYLFEETVTDEQIEQAYMDIKLASEEVYTNYASVYFASILAHELIHSTHISNEAVTYNMCEMLEDDFRNQAVSTSWSTETQDRINELFEKAGLTPIELNSITYGELYLPLEGGGSIGFHDLGSDINDIAAHGHAENIAYNTDITYEDGTIAYKAYTNFSTGNTLEDDKKELMNFFV